MSQSVRNAIDAISSGLPSEISFPDPTIQLLSTDRSLAEIGSRSVF